MNEEHTKLDLAVSDLRLQIGTNIKLVPNGIVSELDQHGLINRALEILGTHIELGQKYFELCSFIRQNRIPPKPTRQLLGQCGFNKVRISEILRVSNVPDEMWQPYKARAMSFLKVLELARLPGVPTDDQLKGFIDVTSVKTEEKQAATTATEGSDEKEPPKEGSKEKSDEEIYKERATKAAVVLLKTGEYFNWKEEVYRNGSEWEVVVRKVKKQPTKKAKANNENR